MDVCLKLEKAFQYLDKIPGKEAARKRRKRTLRFLYHERYLTRKGLAWRLQGALGLSPKWLIFVVDLWFIWRAFRAAGSKLAYSWLGERRGFYLQGEGELSLEMERAIQGAVAEVDPRQVKITRRLTAAQRVQQGLSLTNLANRVVRYRKENWREGTHE